MKFSILLVEDNPADAGLVREALNAHGIVSTLLVIEDGDKAIRYIEAQESQQSPGFDLVIVDLNLPKRSGRDVLRAISQSPRCRAAAVVVLSSSDVPQDQADAVELGARRYIRKPLRLKEFLSIGAIFKDLLSASRADSGRTP